MKPLEIVSFIKSVRDKTSFIPLHAPIFNGNEKKYLLDCIDSTYVSSVGPYVDEFELKLAQYCGAKYAVAMVNGTCALHLSMLISGVQENDLVLTQALSFVATCNAISYLKAVPVFIDIDKETLGMSPEKLAEFLSENAEVRKDGVAYHKQSGKRISTCVPMHTFGHPCRIDEISIICTKYNIALIEDAAEAVGSFYKNKHVGTFGAIGVFSFNGNKVITSGGGGALVTNNPEIAQKAKHLSTQAKVAHRWEFNHDAVAFNYRMPNINAALACAQLEQLPDFLQSKRTLALSYAGFFQNSEIKFVYEPEFATSNYWLCSVLFSDLQSRNDFLEFSNNEGCMTRPCWTLLHKLGIFSSAIVSNLDNSLEIESRLINLPSSANS